MTSAVRVTVCVMLAVALIAIVLGVLGGESCPAPARPAHFAAPVAATHANPLRTVTVRIPKLPPPP